jgi:hypothetical protein
LITSRKSKSTSTALPAGYFWGLGKAVVIKAENQVIIEFRRNWVNYVSLSEHAEMTVEIGTGRRRFLLKNLELNARFFPFREVKRKSPDEIHQASVSLADLVMNEPGKVLLRSRLNVLKFPFREMSPRHANYSRTSMRPWTMRGNARLLPASLLGQLHPSRL